MTAMARYSPIRKRRSPMAGLWRSLPCLIGFSCFAIQDNFFKIRFVVTLSRARSCFSASAKKVNSNAIFLHERRERRTGALLQLTARLGDATDKVLACQ